MTLSIRFLLLGAIYGLIGMCLGMAMGAQENFTLAPVHAHLNLLGWVALSIYGIVYKVYPAMGKSRLARTQFYLVNAAVLLLIPALAVFLLGHKEALPALIIGELLTGTSLVLFAANLWRHRAETL